MEKYNKRSLCLSFLPLLIAFILYYIAYYAAFFMTFISSGTANAATDDIILINEGFFNVIRFLAMLITFASWYLMKFHKINATEDEEITSAKADGKKALILIPLLIILAFSLQLFVSALLNLLTDIFPSTLKNYSENMESLLGSKVSWLTIFSTILLAPIAEELLFRGVTFSYAREGTKLKIAIFIQAMLFAIYHLNMIQGCYAFLIGILLGVLCYRFRSILPGIFLHIFINASAYIIPSGIYSTKKLCLLISLSSLVVILFMIYLIFRMVGRNFLES